MAATSEDNKLKIDQACSAGDEFQKLFYSTFDKKRHLLNKLYHQTANVTWNGNVIRGLEEIMKFYEKLPSSEHMLESLDCQPIGDQATKGQTTIVVVAHGIVKYEGNKPKNFFQTFILTSQDNVWKIVNDCFRSQD